MNMKEIKEAKEELVRLSSDENERMAYNRRKMAILDRVSDLENAEEKGMEKGIEKVALEMIKDGVNIEVIMKFTKLSKENIEELRKIIKY